MRNDTGRISEALKFIDPSARDTWCHIGMAIKSGLGEPGFEVWNNWSKQAKTFNSKDAQTAWKSFREGGKITIATLYYEAKANGWHDDGTYQKPDPAKFAERQRIAAEQALVEDAEIARDRFDTAKKAAAIWEVASEAKSSHPYLSRKQVSPVETLREIDVGAAARILGYHPKSSGEFLAGRLLVVPVTKGDALFTLELIDGTKRKAALAGRGTKAGGYWKAQSLPDSYEQTILIGEGVATVLSGKEATGHPAIAALSASNLLAVAKAMRDNYPMATLVILADLVKGAGEPNPHAIEAAQSVGGNLAIPSFGPERDPDMTDFNDMVELFGYEVVAQTIANAKAPAKPELKAKGENSPASNADCNFWPDPQPLNVKVAAEPYPIDALPNTIRAAVEEVAGFVKAPLAMVASSALAALSLVSQAHADAKRAERLNGPIGLFLLTIADSGERKSTCDSFFTKPIRDYEEAQAEAAKPIQKDHKAAVEAWEAKRCGVKEKIRQLAKAGNSTRCEEIVLRDLEYEQPEQPRIPRMLYTDATPEALAFGLASQWPSAGVVSAEAGIVFGSHGMGKDSVMRNLGLLNQLWDGTPLTIDRRSTESFMVRGARLTVALQVQEPTLREFFNRSGALARGTGFLARFLVAWPDSTQGFRPFTEAPDNWPHLTAFHQRLSAILAEPMPINNDGALTPPMLPLTVEAKAAWVEYHNAIESELASGGELYDVRDVASKSADNAARLAALFQKCEGGGGAICYVAFEGASRIAAWHLKEARRFFGELALPPELANAARLDRWLIGFCRQEQTHFVGKNRTRQFGPLRDGSALDAAIRELAAFDRIRLIKDGKKHLTIQVNPALIPDVCST